jgi:hypothetical protein
MLPLRRIPRGRSPSPLAGGTGQTNHQANNNIPRLKHRRRLSSQKTAGPVFDEPGSAEHDHQKRLT